MLLLSRFHNTVPSVNISKPFVLICYSKAKNTVSLANSERFHKLCLKLPVCYGRWSGCIFFFFFQLFNYLTTCQMEQMTHLSLLHANQAVVPAAAPAPGFEHLMCHPRIKLLDQKLHTAKKPGKLAKRA